MVHHHCNGDFQRGAPLNYAIHRPARLHGRRIERGAARGNERGVSRKLIEVYGFEQVVVIAAVTSAAQRADYARKAGRGVNLPPECGAQRGV